MPFSGIVTVHIVIMTVGYERWNWCDAVKNLFIFSSAAVGLLLAGGVPVGSTGVRRHSAPHGPCCRGCFEPGGQGRQAVSVRVRVGVASVYVKTLGKQGE